MPETKRKRQEEKGERPSKKAAVSMPEGKLRIEHVQNKDGLGPVLASTPGLKFPSNISLKAYRKTHILPTGAQHDLILHSSDHPRLDYSASVEKDGSSDSLLKHYIGVFDPATRKLQVVEVPRLTVRSTLRSEIEELRDENERIEAIRSSMTAKRHALAAEFGSKKSKKAIANISENAIARGRGTNQDATKDEAVASAVLHGMSQTTSAMPTQAELQSAVDSSKPRPTPNLGAEYAADVYTTDAVVGKELMAQMPIKDWVQAAASGIGINVPSRYVAKRINKLVKIKELEKLKVLRFILCCINFNAGLRSKGKGPKSIPPREKMQSVMGEDIPPPITDALRRKFASETNDMTRWHIDNLMTHIAAAALIVDNLEVDVMDLRDDLKLENKEIKSYFHELGCRISAPNDTERSKLGLSKAEAANHFMAKLKLPLSFPKLGKGRREKR